MEKLSDNRLIGQLLEISSKSPILKSRNLDNPWTVNELEYGLKLLQAKNTGLRFTIIIEDTGISIPVELLYPVFINCGMRSKHVLITSIEKVKYEDEDSTATMNFICVKEV